MIIVRRRNDFNELEPMLVYDADAGEMWGYPEMWASHVDKVGLSEEEFSRFFQGFNFFASPGEEDPFEEVPNAEELLKNYPPGSDEIPDAPTPEPPEALEANEEDAAEKIARQMADTAAESVSKDDGGPGTGN